MDAQMQGPLVMDWQPTARLRWHRGFLEQLWRCSVTHKEEWRLIGVV